MRVRNRPPLHLTYCLNVHPGETWAENRSAIETHALAVRDQVAGGKPFGLGLRLSHQAAETLHDPRERRAFKDFLAAQNLYAFTINGFPYGTFHAKPVKADVYRPDWSEPERLAYTLQLADILADLLPEGVDGSISTVPLSYKAWGTSEDNTLRIVTHLAECVAGLHTIQRRTGREIHIGLEPEPDCRLETTDEVVSFFEGSLTSHGIPIIAARVGCSDNEAEALLRRHLGVCFDTCHLALQFETLALSLARLVRHGIRISKVQLSSALEAQDSEAACRRFTDFVDPVYLHQVKCYHPGAPGLKSFADLPLALAAYVAPDSIWRVHFHVPLYFEESGALRSTSPMLDAAFWDRLVQLPISHLEIETYTFHVLPPAWQAGGVDRSICREFEWVMTHLRSALQQGRA